MDLETVCSFLLQSIILAVFFIPPYLFLLAPTAEGDTGRPEISKESEMAMSAQTATNCTNAADTQEQQNPNPEPVERDLGEINMLDSKREIRRITEGVDTEPNEDKKGDVVDTTNNNGWRCACEGGFLPPGILQRMGGAEAVFRMSAGQCYHKS